MFKLLVLGLTCLSSAALASQPAASTEFYRYKNDKNIVVIDRLGVPPQFIEKGYEVVDDQGRVLRTIAPAPTREQREQLLKDKARAQSDAQLLRIYSEVADVDRARDRKLLELDGVIGVAQANLSSVRTQQANLQARAAEFERAGRAVPEHLLVQIDNLQAEQQSVQRDIQRHRAVRKAAEAEFASDRARLVEMRGE